MNPIPPPAKRPALHHLIALTGHAGVGKDTAADLLVVHARFRKLAFADALRGEVVNAFGLSLVDLSPLPEERSDCRASQAPRAA